MNNTKTSEIWKSTGVKSNTVLGYTIFVHYVKVSGTLRALQELENYKKLIEAQLNFDDVLNIYIPVTNQPTKIDKLI